MIVSLTPTDSLRTFSLPFTKSAGEPTYGIHLSVPEEATRHIFARLNGQKVSTILTPTPLPSPCIKLCV